jgi:hypothetical protein
LIDSLGQ